MKEEIKEAIAEGLKGFRAEFKTEVVNEVGKTVDEKVKAIDERVKKVEALPVAKMFNIKTTSGKYKGYDLSKQLVVGRNLAAKNPRLFPILGNDEKAEEMAKWLINVIKARRFHDMQAMADLREFYASKANPLQEGTASEGGYLVPDEFAWDMVGLARGKTFALQACTVIPMNSDQLYLPKEATLAAVAWTDEETAATEGSPTFGQVSLTAKKLDGLATVSNELLQDSGIDITGLLSEQFGYAVSAELDNQVLNGTGSPCSGTLTSAVGADVKLSSGNTNFSAITADDLSNAIYQLEGGYLADAQFIVNRIGLHYIRTLKDSNNAYVFAKPGNGVPGTIWEHPYFMSHKITNTSAAETAFISFGNYRYFYIGRRLGVTGIDVDPYGKFAENQTRFRIVTRWGLAMGNSSAFARILTATT